MWGYEGVGSSFLTMESETIVCSSEIKTRGVLVLTGLFGKENGVGLMVGS